MNRGELLEFLQRLYAVIPDILKIEIKDGKQQLLVIVSIGKMPEGLVLVEHKKWNYEDQNWGKPTRIYYKTLEAAAFHDTFVEKAIMQERKRLEEYIEKHSK